MAAAAVQQLAADYVAATGIPVHGRVAQIKILIRHALDDLAKRGDESDAGLIRDLFFGDSANAVVLSAGELLENAQRRIGETSEVRFRERRQTAFRAFAGFLLQFVDEARRGEEERRAKEGRPGRKAGGERTAGRRRKTPARPGQPPRPARRRRARSPGPRPRAPRPGRGRRCTARRW